MNQLASWGLLMKKPEVKNLVRLSLSQGATDVRVEPPLRPVNIGRTLAVNFRST
jgi:hypothetical protein